MKRVIINNKTYINNKHKKIVEDKEYKYIGSYKSYETTIDGKNKKGNIIYIRVKCPYCGTEYDIGLQHFKNGVNCINCCNKYENSFAYFIEQELKEPLNKYWDFEKNKLNPYYISKCAGKKVWIKCVETNYHGSYEIECSKFTNNGRCPYCASKKVHPKDSFGQWCIDNIDKNFLEKYWSDKNSIDPFSVSINSNKKVWIKCQETDYHGDYEINCDRFTRGGRCPYCVNRKVHKLDSFGYLYPEKAKYWSKKNKLSPYEVAPMSEKKIWFYCEDCGEEFQTKLYHLTNNRRSMKCINCTLSKGEQKIKEWLIQNNINFIPQKQFFNLIGLGGGNLSYDFYLPDYNLLIEYQGEQHEYFIKRFYNNKKDFEKQQEHDRRKRMYAIEHNIELLEIWYYDFDNIKNILQNKIK